MLDRTVYIITPAALPTAVTSLLMLVFAGSVIHERRKAAVWLGWALGAFFSSIGTASDLLVTDVKRFWWGYYGQRGSDDRDPARAARNLA